MCIYCGTNNYRQIYKNHHGEIPKDSENRSYDIHHIDGDHSNNSPTNLIAVTLREHYDIHYEQGDYNAALVIASRMSLDASELSRLGSLEQKRRVAAGTHNFLGGQLQRDRIANGSHHLLGDAHIKNQLANGTHISQNTESLKILSEKAKVREKDNVNNGTHRWLTKEHSESVSLRNKKLMLEGKHTSQIKTECPHCGGHYSKSHMTRYHGDKCKTRIVQQS